MGEELRALDGEGRRGILSDDLQAFGREGRPLPLEFRPLPRAGLAGGVGGGVCTDALLAAGRGIGGALRSMDWRAQPRLEEKDNVNKS